MLALRDQAVPESVATAARVALCRRAVTEAQRAYDRARRTADQEKIAEAKRERAAAASCEPSAEEIAVRLAEDLPSRPVGGSGERMTAAHAVVAVEQQLRREIEHVNEDLGESVAAVAEQLARVLVPPIAAAAEAATRSVGALLADLHSAAEIAGSRAQ